MDGSGPSNRGPLSLGAALLRAAALTVVLAALAARVASAQAASSLMIDVGDCVNLKSPGERLDCYERHVAAAKAVQPAPDLPPQAGAVTTAAAPASASPAPAAATAAAAASAAAASSAPSSASTAARPAPPISAAPPVAAAAAAPLPPASHPAAAAPATAPREIVATVTELHETVPNAWLITLDNGQVWRQNIPQRFALKTGQRVTLHGTRWGSSYRLSADTLSGFIQVERVR